MTIANFLDLVASYQNRAAALFQTVNAQDVILAALNDARRQAQREYRFNMARRQAFASLSMKPVNYLADFTSGPGGTGTTVIVSRADTIWEYGTITISSTPCYYPTKQLDFRASAELITSIPTLPFPWQTSTASATTNKFAYLQGTNVFHSNITTPTPFLFDVVEFLPDLVIGSAPDIFLTYFTDWLKFSTILNLNIWLKDTERFNIDATVMTKLWNSVTQFDSQQSSAGSISLD